MELIVWIIIIAVLITRANKKKKKTQQGMYHMPPNYGNMNQNYQGVPNYGQHPQGYQTMSNGQSSQGYQGVPNQNMAQMQAAMSSKQQELKARLQSRYGTPGTQQRQSANQQYAAQQRQNANQQYAMQQGQNDILRRAAANVGENDYDQLEFDMISNSVSSSELMREVNDLILMGYQSDLTFERDFVSEGVELLNSYELETEM